VLCVWATCVCSTESAPALSSWDQAGSSGSLENLGLAAALGQHGSGAADGESACHAELPQMSSDASVS
jgi:hypothetical protein